MAEPTRFDRVLAILADGAGWDVVQRLASAGEMPNLRQHFIERGGLRPATSVFPSVSGPAHLPLLAGLHPGRANLPGIRWAERPAGRRGNFLFRTRSYMAPWRAAKLERDIPAEVRTLFHHIPGLADVNAWFVRGCPPRARMTRFSKGATFVKALATTDWHASNLQAEAAVRRAWQRGFPSVLAVFPAIDELGHRFGPQSEQSYEAYRRFDASLGRLIEELHRRGWLARTLIAITSDHGQTGTHTHVDIDDLMRPWYPRTLVYPKLWRHLFFAQAAAMVSGNSMANLYIQGETGWQEAPDFEAPGKRAADLVAALLAHPAIAHVIYRRAPEVYVLAGKAGRAVVDARGTAAADGSEPARIGFSVEGENPLGYPELPGRVTRDQVAALTAGTGFPDAPWQLVEFFRSPRAGDLVVCARAGFDLRSRFEYQPHNGSH
ncbi:MAG TPA: alkaline phosphatase family protein, partial [Polyangia bacterium]|nr:alkaline phosphatase family protein [Polyangia bacterium]